MNRLFYPAIFNIAEEGGYYITFTDFPECLTQGETMEEAYEMAFDALGLAITSRLAHQEPLPVASSIQNIKLTDEQFLVIIEFDQAAYHRKHNARAVKKTLSIPSWLNDEAMRAGVNFSQILQEALIQKLNIH